MYNTMIVNSFNDAEWKNALPSPRSDEQTLCGEMDTKKLRKLAYPEWRLHMFGWVDRRINSRSLLSWDWGVLKAETSHNCRVPYESLRK